MASEPNKTIISDVIYRADGTPAQGTLLISWPAFSTADGKPVAAGTLSVQIGSNGAVNIPLVPTEGATPSGTAYKVVIALDDGSSSTEYWAVPTLSPATIVAIRSTLVPATVAVQMVSRDYINSQLATAVRKSGDETIAGSKTFESSPLVPPPGTNPAAANKGYVDAAIAAAAPSSTNVLAIARGGTGTNALVAARCVRVADNGNSLESAAGDCGTGGGGTSANADTVDGMHASQLQTALSNAATLAMIGAPATAGTVAHFNGAAIDWQRKPFQDIQDFPGATADVRLNACLAAAIASGGGTCDARGLTGNQTIAAQVEVGNSAQAPVALMLPHNARWKVGMTDGTSCGLRLHGNASILGTATGGSNEMYIEPASASTNVRAFVCTEDQPSGGGQYVRAEGFQIYNPLGAIAAVAALDWRYTFDNSLLERVVVADYTNDNILVYGNCCGSSLRDVTANPNGTGKRGVWFKADTTKYQHGLSVYNLSADHTGPGYANVEISGVGTSADAVNRNINIFNLYAEFGPASGTSALKIADARGIHVYGLTTGIVNSAGNTGVDISNTSGFTRDIRIDGYSYQQAAGSTALVNHVTGESIYTSTVYVPEYYYAGYSSGGTTLTMPKRWVDTDVDLYDGGGNRVFHLDHTGTLALAKPWSTTNGADAGLLNAIGCGATTDQACGINFLDKSGTTAATLQKSNVNDVQLFVGGIVRQQWRVAAPNEYNVPASQVHIFKVNNSEVARIDSAGKGAFHGGLSTGTLATGTAPITTSSTTLNANLNADLLDGKHAASFALKIASGTAALGTSSIAANACAAIVTTTATGVLATDAIHWTPNADITAVTGYTPGGTLKIFPYPGADAVNFKVCKADPANAVTPGAVTLNWEVVR